jgi:aldehyde dehydrogenase (NAD+)
MNAFQNYVNGAWTPARTGATFERRNPADQKDLVGTFPDSGQEDVQAAVDAARAALPAWRRCRPTRAGNSCSRRPICWSGARARSPPPLTREEGKSLAEATGETGRGVVSAALLRG